jgi:Cytochrome P450
MVLISGKTDFYDIFGFPTPADKNIFSITDPAEHKRMKRNVGAAYSMTTFVGLEQYVDSTIGLFMQRMTELSVSASTPPSKRGEPLNMVRWYQWFAFDLIGELSFSRRFGFLETSSDVGGLCKMLDTFIAYTSTVAMLPEMHKFLLGNPIIPYITSPPPAYMISTIAKQEIEKREADPSNAHADFLQIIMANQQRSSPEQFPRSELHRHASVNVTAGSESAGVTLDALTYFLLKHPAVYAKLQDEVNAADAAGKLSEIPLYRETNHDAMPYLSACIKETLRIHPPVSLTLPRYVPPGGAVICGRFFAEGTRVGISAYTVGHDKKLFGEDADEFRPERWLECSPEKVAEMENGCLHVRFPEFFCQNLPYQSSIDNVEYSPADLRPVLTYTVLARSADLYR